METYQLPRVLAQLHGQPIWALLDTGASHSFVHRKFLTGYSDIPLGPDIKLASGYYVRARGPLDLNLQLRDQEYTIAVFVIEDMAEDLILGQDWFVRMSATIDYQFRCIYFGVHQRVTLYWDPQVEQRTLTGNVELDDTNVSPEQRERYGLLLNQFADVFRETLHQPTTKLVQHVIRLQDPTPFKIRRYQYSPEKRKIIQEEVSRMLAAGVIRRSHSAFSSPVVLVRKKNGTQRFCVDYRQLNAQTEDEVSQLPLYKKHSEETSERRRYSHP